MSSRKENEQKAPGQQQTDIHVMELKTFEKFCRELGKDMDRDFCREIEDEILQCPECKVYYDTIRKTVQIYQICEENSELEECREERLFKVLNLEKPRSQK